MEELICSSCNKKWTREKSRGRKPIVCPDCSVADIKIQNQKQPEQLLENSSGKIYIPPKYKAPSKWECSSCGEKVTIYIGIDIPPIHNCRKRLKKLIPLELKSK